MATGTMSSRNSWWMLAIRGIIALLFGLAVFFKPTLFGTFVYLFGVFAIVDGIIAAGTSFDERSTASRWWIVLLEGLVGIVLGILAFFLAPSLLYVIAIWAILMGILELASAFTMQRAFAHEWTMVIAGIVSVVLGIVYFFFTSQKTPWQVGSPLLLLIGIFAIVFAVMMLVRSFQLKTSTGMSSSAATT